MIAESGRHASKAEGVEKLKPDQIEAVNAMVLNEFFKEHRVVQSREQ